MPRLPPGGSLGTPKILGTGATLHLVPLCFHVKNWGCRALKSSARYQKFGVPCPIFSACKWGFSLVYILLQIIFQLLLFHWKPCLLIVVYEKELPSIWWKSLNFLFSGNHAVNFDLLTILCANAARTLQRKGNYSLVSISVEESYQYFWNRFRKALLYFKGMVCLCLKHYESKHDICSALPFPSFSEKG